MSKLIDIPEGTDIIDVKKKMNRMLSVARNESKPTACILFGKPNGKEILTKSLDKFRNLE